MATIIAFFTKTHHSYDPVAILHAKNATLSSPLPEPVGSSSCPTTDLTLAPCQHGEGRCPALVIPPPPPPPPPPTQDPSAATVGSGDGTSAGTIAFVVAALGLRLGACYACVKSADGELPGVIVTVDETNHRQWRRRGKKAGSLLQEDVLAIASGAGDPAAQRGKV